MTPCDVLVAYEVNGNSFRVREIVDCMVLHSDFKHFYQSLLAIRNH